MTIAYGTPDASTTHYEYYDPGLLKSMTTAYGTNVAATTLYFYDPRGRSTTTQYPDGTTTTQAYDIDPNAAGWVDSTTDPAGVITKYVYDEAGRLDQLITRAFDPSLNQFLEHAANYEYDAADRLRDTFDPLNHHTSFTYYPTGQMATSRSWLNATTGYTTSYDYNPAGEQISVTDANDHTTQYQYNERGLLKKTIYPSTPQDTGEVATSQTYDFAGRLLTSTDENGIVTRNAYNAAGQLTGVTLAYGTTDVTTIQYGYNFAGQLASITDAKDHVTTFQYNDAGQQVKKILPDNITYEQFGYNAAGNMVSHRLEDGNTNTFRYDRMNRLTDIVYFDGRSILFEYTSGGERKKASLYPQPLSVPQVYNYSYDPFQRLKQVTYPDGRAVSYTYYDNDLRNTMTTPAGTITYNYDSLDRLTSVSSNQSSVTTYQYDPVGFPTDAYLPNGIHTQYTPNERNQLTNIISKNSANAPLLSLAYDELDNAGNRKKVTNTVDGSYIRWDYDNLYRLKSEKRYNSSDVITWQSSFTYDDAGNRESMTVNGATTTYQYNALDQLTNAGAITYDYDLRGNLNKITNGSQITSYTYNAADQLSNVVLPNNTNITYGYDADGRRVKQTVGSTVTNYLWDEASTYGDVVLEYSGSGSTLASYVLGGNSLISQTRGTTTSYFLQDGQGSTRALTSSTGVVTDTYAYTAFGESFSRTGTTTNPYQYTGQQFDSLTGLYDLRARYYNPALGRFLSQDTYPVNFNNPIELNRYGYTANNPINAIDPSGNQALLELAINLSKNTVAQGALLGAGFGTASALLCGGNVLEGALTGAVFGGAFAGGMIFAPALTSVLGLGGGALGLSAAYQDYQENGITTCNFINGVASVVAIGGSFASGFGGGGPSVQFALAGNIGGSSPGLAIQGVGVSPQILTGLGAISLVNMISGENSSNSVSKQRATEYAGIARRYYDAIAKHPYPFRQFTIAVTEIKGKIFVALSDSAWAKWVVQDLRSLTESEGATFLPIQRGMHAEQVLIRQFGNQIDAMGISFPHGPCPKVCQPLLSSNSIQGAWYDLKGGLHFYP